MSEDLRDDLIKAIDDRLEYLRMGGTEDHIERVVEHALVATLERIVEAIRPPEPKVNSVWEVIGYQPGREDGRDVMHFGLFIAESQDQAFEECKRGHRRGHPEFFERNVRDGEVHYSYMNYAIAITPRTIANAG